MRLTNPSMKKKARTHTYWRQCCPNSRGVVKTHTSVASLAKTLPPTHPIQYLFAGCPTTMLANVISADAHRTRREMLGSAIHRAHPNLPQAWRTPPKRHRQGVSSDSSKDEDSAVPCFVHAAKTTTNHCARILRLPTSSTMFRIACAIHV